MNRFRTKKRAKDTSDIAGTAVNSSDSPSVPTTTLKSSKTFRLGRKNVQEPERKPELDLANALPSSDDFRTSLLMSGLSARFSMLREQDDPKSKIGKAADDSVLFPKRQSRLNDFGFHSTGLHDIAEVSSIKTSIRPPFASNRIDSFHSLESSGDDGGGIMSRAKPGEGNNLFGGRQKIYKIPVGGSNGDMRKMGGRALYEDDVSQSAFQKLRDREREEREREQQERNDEADSSFPLRSNSPPLLGYNRNRETSSTTSSGPSLTRSSTAATSVYSQRTPSVNGHSSPSTPAVPNQSNSIDRSMTKGKRLYETGLDQHLHSQQHLAMNRLENLSRQQAFGARTPSPSPFPNGNVYEHTNASGSTTHHIAIRSASPPPTEPTLGAFDFGVKTPVPMDNPKPLFTAPPLSPPISDGDDQPSLPIQPNDRGKATALGAFSKPVQPYDEKKYSQRQLQMQQGRETPPLRKYSPPRAFNSRQATSGRTRAESNATYSSERSTSSSSGQREFVPRNRNLTSPVARAEPPATDNYHKSSGTFFDSQNEDSSPNDGILETGNSRGYLMTQKSGIGKVPNTQISLQRPPESQHPAHRPNNQQPWQNHNENINRDEPPTISVSNVLSDVQESQPQKASSIDSPTLGPVDDLSGLVRHHLRNDSGASSIYGAPSPGLEFLTNPPPPTSNPYGTKGNPWEINDWDEDNHGQSNGINHASSDPTMNSNSYGVSTYPTSYKTNVNSEKNNEETHNPSWEDEMAQRHKRNGSTETQKEQVDFTNKLASARKRVQENLKSFAESDSRSASPGPGMDGEKDSASSKSNPMGMLRAKSSRESILAKSKNSQSKAMKMLGISSSAQSNSSSPGKQKYDESLWKQEEEEMLRSVKSPRNPPPMKSYRQARRDAQRDRERQVLMRHRNGGARSSGDDEEATPEPAPGAASVLAKAQARLRQHTQEREVEPEKKPSPRAPSLESKSSAATTRSGSRPPSRSARDRSGSDVSRGSKGRNGRHRDDLARAMADGHSSSAQGFFDETASSRGLSKSPAFVYPPATDPPVQQRAVRSGSESNPTHMGYFDNQQPQSVQNSPQIENGAFPRPSPIAPYAENRTPALSHPSPLQSGNNTPTSQGFQSQGRIPPHLKRVVNKSDISEPSLVSKTSHIITIDLPVGASLQNGMHSAPPLPTMDPRRRTTTRTQTMFNGFMGRSNETVSTPSLPSGAYYEETSTFSADEAEQKPKARQKIRKISSEGGNLNGRTRQVYGALSPAVPTFSTANSSGINMF
jgi:hypothetical protein